MPFIHGAVAWAGSPTSAQASLDRMVQAVEALPWEDTDLCLVADEDRSCALGGQSDRRAPDGRPAGVWRDGSGQLSVVADLRLHDRGALIAKLGFPRRPSVCDEQLVTVAYRRWGPGCASHLLGEGAFALWDQPQRRLMCWRDTAGARPLYYHYSRTTGFRFSSDLRSLTAHPAVPRRLDLTYTRSLLEVDAGFQHPARTLIDQVGKLPAGHALCVDASGLRVWPYWRPGESPERRYRDDRVYVEELRELLGQAVADRLPPPPLGIGVHLSGGLDSSSIAVVAARELAAAGRPLQGFSWSPAWETFPEQENDERHLVESVARYANVPVRFARHDIGERLDIICRDRALHPSTMLEVEVATQREAIAAGTRTILSGWGGDEGVAFNGRGFFADRARRGHLRLVQRELRQRAERHGGSLLGAWRHRVLEPLLADPAYLVLRRDRRPQPRALPSELRSEFASSLAEVEPLTGTDLRERAGVRRMQVALLTNGYLQYRMESWAAFGARAGIEYAFPLLDRRVVDFALSIPDHLYFKHGWKRWLYREATQGILPDAVRWHADKSESSLSNAFRSTEDELRVRYRERLAARRDNPFVDVDHILAAARARDAGQRPTASANGAPDPAPVGSGAWLAFTELDPA